MRASTALVCASRGVERVCVGAAFFGRNVFCYAAGAAASRVYDYVLSVDIIF